MDRLTKGQLQLIISILTTEACADTTTETERTELLEAVGIFTAELVMRPIGTPLIPGVHYYK